MAFSFHLSFVLAETLCNQCVLQWRYIAGNNWGMCDDGIGAVGCGPQEEFRSCSDIALTTDARPPIRPVRPTIRVTTPPQVPKKEHVEVNKDNFNSLIFLITLLLLLIISGIGIWLVFKYYPLKVAEWKTSLLTRLCKKEVTASKVNLTHNPIMSIDDIERAKNGKEVNQMSNIQIAPPLPPLPPLPPPRPKRDSRVKENSNIS